MIFLYLFLTFFEIGTVSFGGGGGMFALVMEKTVQNGWMTEGDVLRFFAVSESTPGPIAINMATFIGASQGGFFGALCATLGVITPAMIIILLIASLAGNFLKSNIAQAALSGIRPAIAALLFGTALKVAANLFFGFSTIGDTPTFDRRGVVILGILFALAALYRKLRKKSPSPFAVILVSAGLGLLFYGV